MKCSLRLDSIRQERAAIGPSLPTWAVQQVVRPKSPKLQTTIPAMRTLTIAALLSWVFACPEHAQAFECPGVPIWQQYYSRACNDLDYQGAYSEPALVKRREDAEARAELARLDRTPIIFRGHIARTRDLSNVRATSAPVSLIVFEDVTLLKGVLRLGADRKAFIVVDRWCDSRCEPASRAWPRGQTATFGADPFVGPREVMDVFSKNIIYKGRTDAVADACGVQVLKPLALKLLSAPGDEIDRLKREYPPCDPN